MDFFFFFFFFFFLRDFIFKKTLFEKLQYLKQEGKSTWVCNAIESISFNGHFKPFKGKNKQFAILFSIGITLPSKNYAKHLYKTVICKVFDLELHLFYTIHIQYNM